MGWVVGLIIILGLCYFIIVTPEIRGILIGVLVVIAGLVGWLLYREYDEEHKSKTLISTAQVELRDMGVITRTGIKYIQGSVKNLSPSHALKNFTLRVRAHDCPSEKIDDACEIVGESTEDVKIEVPAGQVRAVERTVRFTNLPPARTLVWSYEVLDVRAVVE